MSALPRDPRGEVRFGRRTTLAGKAERVVFALLRALTYLAIAATAGIILHIAWYGAPALFKASPPFIDTGFLLASPQTLHVFEPAGRVAEIRQLRGQLSEARPAAPGGSFTDAEIHALRDRLKGLGRRLERERLTYSDREYRALEEKPPADRYIHSTYPSSAGGIGPAVAGSLLLVAGSVLIAAVLGVLSAIYLSEYGRNGASLYLIRLSIINLSGVPSIVFGLFGFGLFVLFFGWGVSLLAGWLTLALMALPAIITDAEEALRGVPRRYREGSQALGASKWAAIRTNVLPNALPGILTSSAMTAARIAGETAPILFTAAYTLRDRLPWQDLDSWYDLLFQGVMALPYHVYVVTLKLPHNEFTRDMQYGTVLTLLLLVGLLAGFSHACQSLLRRRKD